MNAHLLRHGDQPAIVAELVDVIGEAAYLQLAGAMGGASFYVPRNPGPAHALTAAIGAGKAALVGEYFHGQDIVLPVRQLRRMQVVALADRLSADAIAARLQVSRRYVYQVLADVRAEREPDLFG